ncbi:uncharacterized protein LOC131240622 [Magnolia sinica]|uniref:uncharacterized protein LOC131240622 n=1 Tax=Magnolia sinica TaxID=86752 RepID=UPI0026584360|nr:uncharacterized protein LOC131240622 [Magnolia sinica]
MGSVLAKGKGTTKRFEDPRVLNQKIRVLEEELMQVKFKREQAHQHQSSVFAAKESEWRRERKRWKEEVCRLKKKLQEKEETIRLLEEETTNVEKGDKEWQMLGTNLLVEHMRAEQARREEAVEKWKRLYLAIKTELDDLIRTTAQGERLWWGAEEEDMMEALQRELKAKEEMVKGQQARLSALEKEGAKREREVDILRQSLRIMSNTKKAQIAKKNLPQSLQL